MPSMTLRQYEKSCFFFHNNEMAASKRRTTWMRERGIRKVIFTIYSFVFLYHWHVLTFQKML